MAWTVDNIFKFTKFLTRKNQTASITPDNLFHAWNSEQRNLQGELLGKFQARSNGKSGTNTGLIENETILSMLAPFTVTATVAVAINGNATKPTDLVYLLTIRCADKPVIMVNKGQIYSVINNTIDPPSVTNGKYYGTEYDTFYKIWPAAAGSLAVDYIKNPPDIVWGYTLDANGVAQYNAGTSVQPVWRDMEIQEITKRTLKSFGVSFGSQDMQQFAQSNILTGS